MYVEFGIRGGYETYSNAKIPIQVCSDARALEYICLPFTGVQFRTCLANGPALFVPISKCICCNFRMYSSQVQNVFVPISKCICPIFKMYLFQFQSVFLQIAFSIVQFRTYLANGLVAILPE